MLKIFQRVYKLYCTYMYIEKHTMYLEKYRWHYDLLDSQSVYGEYCCRYDLVDSQSVYSQSGYFICIFETFCSTRFMSNL